MRRSERSPGIFAKIPSVIAWVCLLGIVGAGVWVAAGLCAWRSATPAHLSAAGYPSPDEAERQLDDLARTYPERCRLEEIGRSGEGRRIRALRITSETARARSGRPRLLVTAHIHAVEFIGAYVARAVARRLVEAYGRDDSVTELLDRAEVVVAPQLNPDGAARIWQRGGITTLAGARVTSRGVDPNRNFPRVPDAETSGRRAWNTARDKPGSAWYAGPHPLSEPECEAISELCRRERFRSAVHFHSFGCVVYMPDVPPGSAARNAFDVFDGPFQSRQARRYRAVREQESAIVGQLDPYLLAAFGTPSVTVEVSRPSWPSLRPDRLGNIFWISNPVDPERWVANDADATIRALVAQLDATDDRIVTPSHPGLGSAE